MLPLGRFEAADQALDLDTIASLSRSASALLDNLDDIDDQYVLEVSSPGIDRPLVRPKDYERFLGHEAGDGPIKSFTLRGIKDSPPYLHDGRCLTLEDTVEFFNLVLELKLTQEEKQDLVAFLRQL